MSKIASSLPPDSQPPGPVLIVANVCRRSLRRAGSASSAGAELTPRMRTGVASTERVFAPPHLRLCTRAKVYTSGVTSRSKQDRWKLLRRDLVDTLRVRRAVGNAHIYPVV